MFATVLTFGGLAGIATHKYRCNTCGKSHFRPAKPLTVTHGDAWENASGTGRKKIEHVNKQQSNVDSKNADLTWKAGKKQSKDNTQKHLY